jgi:hypothetical protein
MERRGFLKGLAGAVGAVGAGIAGKVIDAKEAAEINAKLAEEIYTEAGIEESEEYIKHLKDAEVTIEGTWDQPTSTILRNFKAQTGDIVSEIPAAMNVSVGDRVAVNREGLIVRHDPTKPSSDPSSYLVGVVLNTYARLGGIVSSASVLIKQNNQWIW